MTWRAIGLIAICATWGCVSRPTTPASPPATPVPTSAPTHTAVPSSPPDSVRGARPIRGWIADYDTFIATEILKHPKFLHLSGERMAGLCARWDDLDEAERVRFYEDFLRAVASAESGWDRTTMFNETGIIDPGTHAQSIDPVTDFPVISEGLLQLSYQDMRGYSGCTFDWNADKDAFEADLAASHGAKSFQSTHPDRSILDPYVNLSCGLAIMDRLATRHSQMSAQLAWAKYWSTLRPGTPGFVRFSNRFNERNTSCH